MPSPIYAIAFSQSKRIDFESGRQANAFAGLGKGRGFDRPRHRRITYSASMTRDAIMAELLEIEGILEDDRFNDEIHPNRTSKGYAGIRIGLRAAEGEGEMTDEDESDDPGIIVAAERAIP